MEDCVFCKISSGEIPSEKIYENEEFFSIPDANPVAEGHSLVISKKHFETSLDIPNELGSKVLDCIKETANKLMKKYNSSGFNIVNISPVAWAGKRIALPFHFIGWMEDIGWEFKEDIVWEKTVAIDRRSGVLLQHSYPGYYYPSLVAEYIFVFQKPADKKKEQNIYYYRSQEEKEANRIDISNFNGEMSQTVWRLRPLSPQENIHPCPFPLELPERIIKFYSYKGDRVINIFAGSGQTLIAAKKLGRRFIGIETQQEYIDYSIQQLKDQFSQISIEEFTK
ncbi:HIT domain-containing protein [archaeon]|nr:HIT domain-containing protein [archaeon]